MVRKKGHGFTLIELIAVLVIMAIIALIATPLVMNIIRKARTASDKRSIDAYGRSIELAIAGYLLDTGKFPTEVSQLTIEYSGNEVVCTTTQLNSDSSVYLAGCTVGGRSVEGYTYGKEATTPTPSYTAYQVGDHVSYNGVTYYVIEDSDTSNDTVKLLKENSLTYAEINALNLSGITISEDGYVQYGNSTDYLTSTVKQVVDAWKNTAVASGDTVTARLITIDELRNNLGYGDDPSPNNSVPIWVYNIDLNYWVIDFQHNSSVWYMGITGYISSTSSDYPYVTIRPVLELNKSAEITKLA